MQTTLYRACDHIRKGRNDRKISGRLKGKRPLDIIAVDNELLP